MSINIGMSTVTNVPFWWQEGGLMVGAWLVWRKGVQRKSLCSAQFCPEPKTAPKMKFYFKNEV